MLLDLNDLRLIAYVAAGGLFLLWMVGRIRRRLRLRRPARLNPKLQQYGDTQDVVRARRQEATKIVATSSTGQIVGYDIVEQVEAVFVDGFRRPEEALEGLKAAAAMKGGNALTNVHSERTAAGRCSARGDAVVVRKIESDG
jgi:hypothetical protein